MRNIILVIFFVLIITLIFFSILVYCTDKQLFLSIEENIRYFTNDFISIPQKIISDYIISIAGFSLTAFGFFFVIIQLYTLTRQIRSQEQQHHEDSQFANFLEATKMLSNSHKENIISHISAIYLLYDFAKQYPDNNLEKVVKVLSKYSKPIYPNNKFFTCTKSYNNSQNLITSKKIINEWRDNGTPCEQVAFVALTLIKKLFIYALENKVKADFSNTVIFDLDVENDISKNNLNFFDITQKSSGMIFLSCELQENKIDFSTNRLRIKKGSVKNRLDISLSTFIKCNLTKCDFSYSNLWGVVFQDCILKDTKFTSAECEGSEFLGTSKVTAEQLKSMLFLNEDSIFKFRKNCCERIVYGVIYNKKISNKNICFRDRNEYEKFKPR